MSQTASSRGVEKERLGDSVSFTSVFN